MDWNKFMADIEADIGVFAKEAPESIKGFGIMGKAAKADGALSEKTKEFIALGIAISTQCDSCIGFHMRSLVRLGATRAEVCEALQMAMYMGGGPSFAYSAKALKAYDVLSEGA